MLVLVGDGEDREAAESTAAELGIADRVRFLGYRDDLASIGLLAPVGAVEQLRAEVERLRRDDTLRAGMGELGARRMRERFSVERMVDDTDRLYTEILAR